MLKFNLHNRRWSALDCSVRWVLTIVYNNHSLKASILLHYVVLEKTLGSPLDTKEIKPVNPKGNQLQETVEDRGAWQAAVHGGRKELDMS